MRSASRASTGASRVASDAVSALRYETRRTSRSRSSGSTHAEKSASASAKHEQPQRGHAAVRECLERDLDPVAEQLAAADEQRLALAVDERVDDHDQERERHRQPRGARRARRRRPPPSPASTAAAQARQRARAGCRRAAGRARARRRTRSSRRRARRAAGSGAAGRLGTSLIRRPPPTSGSFTGPSGVAATANAFRSERASRTAAAACTPTSSRPVTIQTSACSSSAVAATSPVPVVGRRAHLAVLVEQLEPRRPRPRSARTRRSPRGPPRAWPACARRAARPTCPRARGSAPRPRTRRAATS